EDADDLEVVVGVPLQVLLTVDTADDGMSRHEDPRLGAVAAGRPAALAGFDAAVRVELRGRLAEVPDVALLVLRVPVGRPLLAPPVHVQAVTDRDALSTRDAPCPLRDEDDVTGPLAVLDPGVDPTRARKQRVPLVIHPLAEVPPMDARSAGRRQQPR